MEAGAGRTSLHQQHTLTLDERMSAERAEKQLQHYTEFSKELQQQQQQKKNTFYPQKMETMYLRNMVETLWDKIAHKNVIIHKQAKIIQHLNATLTKGGCNNQLKDATFKKDNLLLGISNGEQNIKISERKDVQELQKVKLQHRTVKSLHTESHPVYSDQEEVFHKEIHDHKERIQCLSTLVRDIQVGNTLKKLRASERKYNLRVQEEEPRFNENWSNLEKRISKHKQKISEYEQKIYEFEIKISKYQVQGSETDECKRCSDSEISKDEQLKDSNNKLEQLNLQQQRLTVRPEHKTQLLDSEPEVSDSEEQDSHPEPEVSDPEEQDSHPEPEVSDPEEQDSHPEPEVLDSEPEVSDSEEQDSHPEPEVFVHQHEVSDPKPEVSHHEEELSHSEVDVSDFEIEFSGFDSNTSEVDVSDFEIEFSGFDSNTSEVDVSDFETQVSDQLSEQ
ncbi:golgin subfamily A member 6-like protein 22 isoform X3 [Paralichthys olivaceus]|uniref:golgin subfamily A member 6-like protein 22 isoform X3 n=1 Tax=Paralichthys olivaceus TaxID=8255 RepID=UPI003753A2DB